MLSNQVTRRFRRYMSPERLKGERYSWPADVWCAGMIMLELAFGDHPYKVYFGEEDGSFMAMLEYTPTLHATGPAGPLRRGGETTGSWTRALDLAV
jgi:serine/threonine protein kinase